MNASFMEKWILKVTYACNQKETNWTYIKKSVPGEVNADTDMQWKASDIVMILCQ